MSSDIPELVERLHSVWPTGSPNEAAGAKLMDEAATALTQAEATIAALRKVRDGYASQMKFCDIEALGYFREFVRRIDTALSGDPS